MDTQVRGDKSILLVEDDELIRGAMKMVLEWEGYRVLCAGNGQEALDCLRQGQTPSLILLDMMMPVCDGEQFREAQKQDPALASIPVVVVSAARMASTLDDLRRIQKPFDIQELLKAVRAQEEDETSPPPSKP
jgi:CheY-like chemotaxis protein